MRQSWLWSVVILIVAATVLCTRSAVLAVSTGNITGTVVRADNGAPVARAAVTAVAPTGTFKAVTDAHGFFSLLNLSADTYTVTVAATGFDQSVISGVTVFQEQTITLNPKLNATVTVIGRIPVNAQRTNLVQPNVTSNTYNVTSAQMNTILNDSTHHTLYDVLWRTPGITSGPTNNSPTIRGGTTTELGWEFEEIPIVDRTVGFYSTELSTTGIGNVEVTTGGLSAEQGGSTGGSINMTVKQGAYPGKGSATFGVGGPAYNHTADIEYGSATPNNAWSWYVAGSYTNNDQLIGDRHTFYYQDVEGFDFVNTKDNIVNLHHHWGSNNQNDLQYVAEEGVGIFRPGYGGAEGRQLSVEGVTFDSNGNEFANLVLKGHADSWYHWYTIQKVAFSHTINDRSYYRARVAQSSNGYFFDEKWAQNIGEPCLANNCTFTQGSYNVNDIWCYGCYYQDRHTLQTFWNVDYANQLTSRQLIKFGLGYEFDKNYRAVANFLFNTDFNNNWPDYRYVTQAPTHLYGAYVSDHINVGKWVFEPGLRWDMERYSISPVKDPITGVPALGTANAFNASFVSPRIAATYQASPSDVFRGSYGHLAQFIGTAYAEDFSVDQFNDPATSAHGYYFNGSLKPSVAKTFDFSWEHSFPNDVSLRVTPYSHNNDDYVVEYRPPGTLVKFRPTLFTNGAATHTKGVEVGVSRQVLVGLSTFLSFTYNDTKSNVTISNGPFFGGRNANTLATIAANDFEPASFAAPWSANLALDWKRNGWEVDSNTIWSTGFPYGIGRQAWDFDANGKPALVPNDCVMTNQGNECLSSAEAPNSVANSLRGPAWYNENLSLSHSVGHGRVGVTVYNLFNLIKSPNFSANDQYENTTSSSSNPRNGNWAPAAECSQLATGAPCFDAIYSAPNAFHYPVAGYYRQEDLTPRQTLFWWRIDL
ncbi:MAG: TonB-dependent receptor [Candidatus Eremiobacteraeota bacterium]|nr:TonB-dependent receptor [Candidatus Eremiobacteraeota bacterium]MBC5827186.1 TonB-dependent receptor [Candidatus Eremiobacteraeota bacterium]